MKHVSRVFAEGVLVSLVAMVLTGVANYATRLMLFHSLSSH